MIDKSACAKNLPEGSLCLLVSQHHTQHYFLLQTGGWVIDKSACPKNLPEGAPEYICGHVALVEVDAKASD